MVDIDLSSLKAKVSFVGGVLAGKKPTGLSDYYNQLVFTGSELLASTHEVGASVKFESSFKGAVDGALFCKIVKSLAGTDVSLTTDKKDAFLRIQTSGGVDVKLPLSSADESAILVPSSDNDNDNGSDISLKFSDAAKLGDVLEKALVCVTDIDDPRTALSRVHLYSEDDTLACYSSDGPQFSRSVIESAGELAFFGGLELNSFFCRLYLDTLAACSYEFISFGKSESYTQVIFGSGETRYVIQAGVLDAKKKESFDIQSPYNAYLENFDAEKCADVPDGMKDNLEFSKILVTNPLGDESVTVKIDAGNAFISSGRVDGRGTLKTNQVVTTHDDVSVKVSPVKLLKFFAFGPSKFLIDDKCFALFVDGEYSNSVLLTALIV